MKLILQILKYVLLNILCSVDLRKFTTLQNLQRSIKTLEGLRWIVMRTEKILNVHLEKGEK